MKDYEYLGSSPCDENCVQLQTGVDYLPAMRTECERYRDLIEKAFPPPEGGRVSVKSFPHDFGIYLEVVAWFDEDYPESVEWAFNLENVVPGTWKELETLAKKKEVV